MAENENGGAAIEELQPLTPGRLFGGRYRLEERIGRGGMASVWRATDERLGRQVAVKFLAHGDDEEFVRRFSREAKLAARLHHPNLVSVYDFDAGVQPYLVMEYIDGGTITDRLAAGDPPNAERLGQELLTALSAIHAAGVLHRDVKPGNVLFDSGGNARLVDFGIALAANTTSLTRTGLVVGTESYMAPEVRAGDPASERSDLYSLGVLLAEVAEAGGAGDATWALIERLRADDPQRRPRSASAALAQFERDLGGGSRTEPTARMAAAAVPVPAAASAEGEPPPPARSGDATARRRPGRALGIAALALIVAALVAGLALAPGDDDGDASGEGGGGAEKSSAENGDQDRGAVASTPEAEPALAEEPVDGAALNQDGFALSEQGLYEEAIPVLEEAVAALEGSGDELTYNYALFNLAHALRMAGRPEEAIPLLEQRLAYPDQEETVAAELAAAQEAAGYDVSGDEKRDKGPKDKAPPGQEKHEE